VLKLLRFVCSIAQNGPVVLPENGPCTEICVLRVSENREVKEDR